MQSLINILLVYILALFLPGNSYATDDIENVTTEINKTNENTDNSVNTSSNNKSDTKLGNKEKRNKNINQRRHELTELPNICTKYPSLPSCKQI